MVLSFRIKSWQLPARPCYSCQHLLTGQGKPFGPGVNERTVLAQGLTKPLRLTHCEQVFEIEMPDKYLRLLTKINRMTVIGPISVGCS